jgi:cysteinyl-tRNA synthetase
LFVERLSDDLNTPDAISVITGLAKEGRWPSVVGCAQILGFDEYILKGRGKPGTFQGRSLDYWIEARAAAKQRRDFGVADQIRADLLDAGVVLEDRPDGTTNWRLR